MTTIVLSKYSHIADTKSTFTDCVASNDTVKVFKLEDLYFPYLTTQEAYKKIYSNLNLTLSFSGYPHQVAHMSGVLEKWLISYINNTYTTTLGKKDSLNSNFKTCLSHKDFYEDFSKDNLEVSVLFSDPVSEVYLNLVPEKTNISCNRLLQDLQGMYPYPIYVEGSGGRFSQVVIDVLKVFAKDLFNPFFNPLLVKILIHHIGNVDLSTSTNSYGYFYPSKVLEGCKDCVCTTEASYIEYVEILRKFMKDGYTTQELEDCFLFYFSKSSD